MRYLLEKIVVMPSGTMMCFNRIIFIPIEPFVGMCIYQLERRDPDSDDSEDEVEHIYYLAKDNIVGLSLKSETLSKEDSITEEELIIWYKDWDLK